MIISVSYPPLFSSPGHSPIRNSSNPPSPSLPSPTPLFFFGCPHRVQTLLSMWAWVWGHPQEHRPPTSGHSPPKKNYSPSPISRQLSPSAGVALGVLTACSWAGPMQVTTAAGRGCLSRSMSRRQHFPVLFLTLQLSFLLPALLRRSGAWEGVPVETDVPFRAEHSVACSQCECLALTRAH